MMFSNNATMAVKITETKNSMGIMNGASERSGVTNGCSSV
jgi:hypothetical protein